MENSNKRTAEEIEQLLTGYKQSGLSRRQYCAEQGIKVTTFDYYRLRRVNRQQASASDSATKLVKVKIQSGDASHQEPQSFGLVLSNGRRIESSWSYCEQELAKLIRLVEAVQ